MTKIEQLHVNFVASLLDDTGDYPPPLVFSLYIPLPPH